MENVKSEERVALPAAFDAIDTKLLIEQKEKYGFSKLSCLLPSVYDSDHSSKTDHRG